MPHTTTKAYSVRLSHEEHDRLVALAALTGTGPLKPSVSAVLRLALALGCAQLEQTIDPAMQTSGSQTQVECRP
jgi:hypothetical protein